MGFCTILKKIVKLFFSAREVGDENITMISLNSPALQPVPSVPITSNPTNTANKHILIERGRSQQRPTSQASRDDSARYTGPPAKRSGPAAAPVYAPEVRRPVDEVFEEEPDHSRPLDVPAALPPYTIHDQNASWYPPKIVTNVPPIHPSFPQRLLPHRHALPPGYPPGVPDQATHSCHGVSPHTRRQHPPPHMIYQQSYCSNHHLREDRVPLNGIRIQTPYHQPGFI